MTERVRDQWNMICPKCGKDDDLRVQVTSWAVITEDGTEDDGDVGGTHWDNETPLKCGHWNCLWVGKVNDAKEAYQNAEGENETHPA